MRSGAKGILGWGRWLVLPIGGLAWLLWLLAGGVMGGGNPAPLKQQFPLGVENTWFQVQNIGTKDASLIADYFSANGTPVDQETASGIAPGVARSFNQATNPDLPSGFDGSAVITADSPIRTLLLKDIERGGGKAFGGETTPTRGFNKQLLPLIYSNFGERDALNTRFVIQNAGNAAACVRIIYRSNDGSVVFTEPDAGSAPAKGCPNGGLALPVRGSIARNQSAMSSVLPQPFIGSVVIEAVSGSVLASQQLLVATADIWRTDNRSFATYIGAGQSLADQGELATTVFLPIVQKNYGPEQGWSTSYQVATADHTQPATVTALYCCDAHLPGASGTLSKTFTVQSSTLIQQALESELPDDFNGSVVLTSDKPIVSIVTRRWKDASHEALVAYNGISINGASRTLWVPLVYRTYDYNWQSSLQMHVVGGGNAGVEITYYGEGLPGGTIKVIRSINGVATFDQSQEPVLPDGFVGSAVIQADKPIVAVVIVQSDYFAGDAAAAYAAFGRELTQATPTPTATPSASPTTTPQPTPTPTGTVNVNLFANWNLVQWFPSSCRSSQDAFGNLMSSGTLRVGWRFLDASQSWLGFDPNVPGPVNTLTQLCSGDIVWVNVTAPTNWSQVP